LYKADAGFYFTGLVNLVRKNLVLRHSQIARTGLLLVLSFATGLSAFADEPVVSPNSIMFNHPKPKAPSTLQEVIDANINDEDLPQSDVEAPKATGQKSAPERTEAQAAVGDKDCSDCKAGHKSGFANSVSGIKAVSANLNRPKAKKTRSSEVIGRNASASSDRVASQNSKPGLISSAWQSMSIEDISKAYSSNPLIQKTLRSAEEGTHFMLNRQRQVMLNKQGQAIRKSPTQFTLRCWRYVKVFLHRGGLMPKMPGSVSAFNAGKDLEHDGQVNLLNIPSIRNKMIVNGKIAKPIEGALYVYGGKPNGDIEIRGKGKYISDYISPLGRTHGFVNGPTRHLIGVYIRPDLLMTNSNPEVLASAANLGDQ
jgi:hypothetical protein